MKTTTSLVFLITGAVVASTATGALAQAPPLTKNIFVDVNLGAQPQSRSFTVDAFPIVYNEAAIIHSTQDVGGTGFFDVQGGYRVWRDLSVGLGLTKAFTNSRVATVTGAIPHPLFYDTRVESTQTVPDLEHSETTTHLFVMWTSPVTDRIDAAVSLGPSYVSVSQDLVNSVNVPAGTQTFTPIVSNESEGVWGFTFGGDVTYLVTPRIGIGGMIRYVNAEVDLPSVPDLSVAGFQIGGGVRFRF
jgi:hypothetical protein